MFGNIIFHIDVNSAFLSREAVYRLAHKRGKQDLREIASAVGGDHRAFPGKEEICRDSFY